MSTTYRLLALAALVAACGGGEPDAGEATADPMEMAGQAGGMAAMAAVNEPIALDESELERFVTTLEALKATGERYEDRAGRGMAGYGAGLAANAEAMAVLRANGYRDVTQFQRVVYTVGAAMAAAELRGREDEMAKAREQMEAMKSQMTEQQYEAMMSAQAGTMGMVENQPEGNVELVAAWKDRIEAAVKN